MKLSIFLAGIRKTNWLNLYQSIAGSTMSDFELVIVSPYQDDEIPEFIHTTENIKHIYDKGCPTRCYQLGLIHSQGEYALYTADDGVFVPNLAIDKAFDVLPNIHKGVVSLRYFEGADTPENRKIQEPDSRWKMGAHKLLNRCPYVSPDYSLVMIGLMRRDYFIETGGFDCSFEQPGLAFVDLAARLQNDGAEVVMGEKCQNLDHSVGVDQWGIDHSPIVVAHKKNDAPLFKRLYSVPSGQSRTRIDVNNWQNAPPVWARRFGKK